MFSGDVVHCTLHGSVSTRDQTFKELMCAFEKTGEKPRGTPRNFFG